MKFLFLFLLACGLRADCVDATGTNCGPQNASYTAAVAIAASADVGSWVKVSKAAYTQALTVMANTAPWSYERATSLLILGAFYTYTGNTTTAALYYTQAVTQIKKAASMTTGTVQQQAISKDRASVFVQILKSLGFQ